jgi:Tfp pilus assembly protein PilN
VKAVNLLPQKHRPAAPTGARRGSAYVVLGALAVVLFALVGYVLTGNSINSAKEQVAQAEKETEEAQAKTRALQPYGDFSSVAQTRLASVKTQAQGRIDWERLVGELAHFLPEGSWLTTTDAAADPELSEGGGSGDATGPIVSLTGCAKDQRTVADTLIRLRRVSGTTDVTLKESVQGEDTEGSSDSAGQSGAEGCGTTGGKANYTWQASLTFDPAQAAAAETGADGGDKTVPARLGGGS